MGPITVRPATHDELDALLPLIAGYQRFYGVDAPDVARNRAHFAHMLAPDCARGMLLGAWDGGTPLGFACLHWTLEDITATEIATLYDLFVAEQGRGRGTGRLLLDAAADAARARGHAVMAWSTALDNRRAQALYESYPAERSVWFEYELPLDAPGRT